MILPNIETFIGCESSFEEASIVLYGAPFDSTTSFRPGARFGPSAMRHESFGLETYSPYQDKDLIDISVFDSGDLELCFGSSEIALSDIQKRAEEILKAGKFPLLLGGEHLVTLGAVRAAAAKYPDLHIIHFDAHADLRDDYLGAKLSHACVLRRCHEIVGDGCIHQFCIRSGERDRSTDKSYPGDNRLISPKSPHRRGGLAPRCRLITSWGWSRSQGLGCSPIKVVRELGSKRRETVWFISIAGARSLRGAAPSTRGPEWTDQRCPSCHASGTAGKPHPGRINAESI